MARAAEQQPRVGRRHIVLPDMHAVGFGGERDVDAVVDQQRHADGASTLRSARASSTMARVEPRLSRNCTSVALSAMRPARSAERAAAGDGGIDQRIEAKIDVHQLTSCNATLA